MSSKFPPTITLGGVALDVGRFTWPFRTGAHAGRTTFEVHADIGAQLADLMKATRPLDLFIKYDVLPGHNSGTEEEQTYKQSGLYIISESPPSNRYLRRFTVADWRYLLELELVTTDFNERRRTNQKKKLKSSRFGGVLAGGSPADFETASTFRYLPHSLRDPGANVPLRNFSNSGKVWSADEILVYLLADYRRRGTVDVSKRNKSGYQPENLAWEGNSLPDALNAVLALSRNSAFIAPNGVLTVFSVDEADSKTLSKVFPPKFPWSGSGWPIKPDRVANRPGQTRVQFVKRHEIRFKFDEQKAPDRYLPPAGAVPTFDLENVLQLPDSVGGRTRGEWVTINDALALWNADGANPLSGAIKRFDNWNINSIRQGFLTELLDFYAFDPAFPGRANPVLQQRVSAIRQAYRQQFRILPSWMDRIASWRAELVSVVDDVTHQRQTALVWQDYTVVPTLKGVYQANLGKAGKNRPFAKVIEGYTDKVEGADRVPAVVSIIDEELGVFRVDFYQDLQMNVGNIIPSKVDNLPTVAYAEVDTAVWAQAELSAEFKLAVLVTVVFSVPNNEARLYQIGHNPEQFGKSRGNPNLTKELLSRRQTADYRWTDQSKARVTANGVDIRGSTLENEELLKAIAKAEAERYYFRMRDRVTGAWELPGWEGADFFPTGSFRQVTVTFDQGGVTTAIDATQPPEPRTFMEMLPNPARRFLFRQLPHK